MIKDSELFLFVNNPESYYGKQKSFVSKKIYKSEAAIDGSLPKSEFH